MPKSTTSSSARSAKYIASTTQSVKFTLIKTDSTGAIPGSQIFILAGSQPYCQTVSAGLTCSLAVNAPVGNDIFDAETFSDTAATQKIGSGAVKVSVQLNATNTATITLGGPIAIAAVVAPYDNSTLASYGSPAPVPTGPISGSGSSTFSSIRLYVIALDTNGDPIVTPDTYSSPVYLTLIDEYSSQQFAYSKAHKPLDVPTDQTADVTQIANISVTHIDGTTSQTTTAAPYVTVTSPTDLITLTASPFSAQGNYGRYVIVGTTVGAPATRNATSGLYNTPDFDQFWLMPGTCPSGWSGTEPSACVSPSPSPTPVPTPSPTPSPCPSGMVGYPSCFTPTITWLNVPAAFTGSGTSTGTLEFPSVNPANPQYVNLGVNLNDPSYAGTVSVGPSTSGDVTACSNLRFTNNNTLVGLMQFTSMTPLSVAKNGNYFLFEAMVAGSPPDTTNGTPPTAGITCHLTVSANDNGAMPTATLTIYGNYVTGGTIQ